MGGGVEVTEEEGEKERSDRAERDIEKGRRERSVWTLSL